MQLKMESSNDDIAKLSHILHMNDSDSDSTSVDSNELIIDCELYDALNDSKGQIIKTCKDPLLKQALVCNLKKRRLLQEIIGKLEMQLEKIKNYDREVKIKIVSGADTCNKNIRLKKRLGAPYFKDADMFPCPPNKDFLEMDKRIKINMANLTKTIWTRDDKFTLYKEVVNEICKCKLKEITKQIEKTSADDVELLQILEHQRNIFLNADSNTNFCKNTFKQREDTKTTTDEIFVIKTVCEWDKKIDWFKISGCFGDDRHSDVECKAMWNYYMNPKFSKQPWNSAENKKLIMLSEKYKYQNWEAIAHELGTNRSSYQCCVHFHDKLCEKFNRDKWTPEEDEYLQTIIDNCSTGKFISWGKVAFHFRHRTKMQIYRHYVNCVPKTIKKGSFSLEEDILLLVAMKIHNNDLSKVRVYFPNRIRDQLRNRMVTLNTDTSKPWTVQEDTKIISWVTKNGLGQWKKLTKEIPRSDGCIRHRHAIIKKFFDLNPGSSVFDIPRRFGHNSRNKTRKRTFIVKRVGGFLLHKLSKSRKKSDILNLEYIKSILDPFLELNTPKAISGRQIVKNELSTINSLLAEFFKSSYKNIVKKEIITDEIIDGIACRVEILLKMFNANVIFPSINQIENHPLLDEIDKKVIIKIIQKRQYSNSQANLRQNFTQVIPSCVESVIGFRSILLNMPILKSHSRSKYNGYSMYIKSGPNVKFPRNGLFYNKHALARIHGCQDEDLKQKSLKETQLFVKRLRMLFQWAILLADSNFEPQIVIKPCEIEPPKEKQKPGRKKKEVKNYKVALMNEARKKTAEKRRHASDADESVKKPKLTQE